MDGYCNSIWCYPGYLSKMVSILFRNIQYKYAETYKAVLFHEGKGVNKGCSQITVICPPPPPPGHAWGASALSVLHSCCVCGKS